MTDNNSNIMFLIDQMLSRLFILFTIFTIGIVYECIIYADDNSLPVSVQKVLSNMQLNDNSKKTITVDNESLYGKQDVHNQKSALQINITSDKESNEETLLSKAYRAWNLGQVESANVLYDRILSIDHTNQSALMALAIIYQKEYNSIEARSYYATVLQIDPYNTIAINNYLSLLAEESPQTALNELKNLIASNPNYDPIPANIGMIYYKLKDYKKAADYFAKALNLSSNNQIYRYNLALSLDHLGMNSAAINLYRQLIYAYQAGKTIPVASELLYNRINNLSRSR